MTWSPWVFFGLVAVVSAVLLVLLQVRASGLASRLRALRAQNDFLRNEFASLIDWRFDGSLPDDPAAAVRRRFETLSVGESATNSDLALAHSLLVAAGPPDFCEPKAEDFHSRSLEILGVLSGDSQRIFEFLSGRELDHIFRTALRLEAYAPHHVAAPAYSLVAVVLRRRLQTLGTALELPRPLSIVEARTAEIVIGQSQVLRHNSAVRDHLDPLMPHFAQGGPAGGFRLVIDCVSPGWRGSGQSRKPKISILDRSG